MIYLVDDGCHESEIIAVLEGPDDFNVLEKIRIWKESLIGKEPIYKEEEDKDKFRQWQLEYSSWKKAKSKLKLSDFVLILISKYGFKEVKYEYI